jgi:fibro-slime domain-containing protein
VHARETEGVDHDQSQTELGIEVGRDYAVDIFDAERHSGESNFRIETSIDCITPVLVI